jgi:hypothetical protein
MLGLEAQDIKSGVLNQGILGAGSIKTYLINGKP